MSILLNRTIEALLLPPGGPLLLIAGGLLLILRDRNRAGPVTLSLGLALLWASSLPVVSLALLGSLSDEQRPLRSLPQGVGAIVVLGGGRYPDAPEYGGDTVSPATLERLRYAVLLQRRFGLPIVTSGGTVYGAGPPEAELMRQVLVNEFRTGPVWTEGESRTSDENARLSARLLAGHGIHRVLLVTHAWHMPRAAAAFQTAGVDVVAAPLGFPTDEQPTLLHWLPSAAALADTRRALHEYLGTIWYAWKRHNPTLT